MESKLFLTCPKDGWVRLTLDSDDFWISYTTDFGYEFLNAIYQNAIGHYRPRAVLFDTEENGYFYIIIDGKELTVCSMGDSLCNHYYFESKRELLDQVMDAMYPWAQEWSTFFFEKEDVAIIELFKAIKEDYYGQTV